MKNQSRRPALHAVLFDLDGTLLDSLEDLADSMNATLERHGYETHPIAAYRHFVGDGMATLVRRVLPAEVRDDAEENSRCLTSMRAEYGKRWAQKTKPYAGIPELLEALTAAAVPKAILSNKPEKFTTLIVQELLADWSFEAVRGQREGVPAKPDPSGALEIAAELGVAPRAWLYVGDTDTDMSTARRAGMFAAGVTWGFRDRSELLENGAQRLAEHPLELMELLAGQQEHDASEHKGS